jgi:hypothetical protein
VRAFFLLLVLANVGFFTWANYFSEGDTQSDPRPLARQVAPEKLRVLSPNAVPKAPPAPAVPAKPAPEGVASAPGKTCVEWGSFAAADVPRATEALAPLALGPRLLPRTADENASWWVFMPPRGGRAEAQKKAAELKALGIGDFFIVQEEGPMRFAVSLGIFKTEAAATGHLETLRAKGVKTAQVGARETALQKTWLQVRQAEDAVVAKLREIAQGFAGSEVRDCPTKPV